MAEERVGVVTHFFGKIVDFPAALDATAVMPK